VNFLLDTNVVSEWVKPRPNTNVMRWVFEANEDQIFLSVLTFAEIRQGVDELAPGSRRSALNAWLENELVMRFEGRILNVDLQIANAWGAMIARSKKMALSLGAVDAFFAATASANEMTFVTRNTRSFEGLGIQLFNPWNAIS
jgi:predicted nucleic acid-binding protein